MGILHVMGICVKGDGFSKKQQLGNCVKGHSKVKGTYVKGNSKLCKRYVKGEFFPEFV